MKDWMFGPFQKLQEPVLEPTDSLKFHCPINDRLEHWAHTGVYNPAAVVRDKKLHIVYRADGESLGGEDDFGCERVTCRIGHAQSEDGVHFKPSAEPVVFPDQDAFEPYEWWGGCQDMHVIEGEDGRYYMNYDGWSGLYSGPGFGECGAQPIMDVLLSATSDDMVHWKKEGVAINPQWTNFLNHSRSGVVLCRENGDKLTAVKLHGKYWMYLSFRGWLESSDDLIHWDPVLDSQGRMKCLFPQYPQYPYCNLACEAGAAAILTEQGIVYFFNGLGRFGEKEIWSVGQALISPDDLLTVLDVAETPLLEPEYNWEKIGHCPAYATVCNTIVKWNGKWRLYYGGADRVIGCAEECH